MRLQWRIAFEITTVFPEKLWVTDIVVDMAIVFDIGLNMQRYAATCRVTFRSCLAGLTRALTELLSRRTDTILIP